MQMWSREGAVGAGAAACSAAGRVLAAAIYERRPRTKAAVSLWEQ